MLSFHDLLGEIFGAGIFPLLDLAALAVLIWIARVGLSAWPRLAIWKRIAGTLLLVPHLLLVLSFIPWDYCALATLAMEVRTRAHVLPGSFRFWGASCPDVEMGSAVLFVFLLPVPALLGSRIALRIFRAT